MVVIEGSDVEIREDIPLKTGIKNSQLCTCNEDFFGGSRFISISFAVLTLVITLALLTQIYYGDFQVVPHGSVATDSRECSEIGTSILKQGGNAVDAAVAAAFCLSVVNPHTAGLDAAGKILIYNHRNLKNAKVIEFGRYPSEQGVSPKLVIGLAYIHKWFGQLLWKDVVLPSANLAKKGFLVSKQLELMIKKTNVQNLYGPLQAGDKIKFDTLAETLYKYAGMQDQVLHEQITETNTPLQSETSKSSFRNYRIYVPDALELLASLQHVQTLNFTNNQVGKPKYIYKLASTAQWIQGEYNVSSIHRGTSSNVAVIDLNDLYVSLIIGMYAPFGSRQLTPEGYLLDVSEVSPIYSRTPFIITDANSICGKRIVSGANDFVTAMQVISALLTGAENAAVAIEFPRFSIFGDGSIGLEDDHLPVFGDSVVQELEKLGKLVHLKEPYDSCNIVEKILDDLNSHSDSRGGGISSRF